MHPTPQHGANEFEIISFIENGVGSKIYDVIQKQSKCRFTMEVIPCKQTTKKLDTTLRKHSNGDDSFLGNLKYSFETKSRKYFVLSHTNRQASLPVLLSIKNCLTESEAVFILAELIVSLEKLHLSGTVYGGVTKNDVFFDSNGHILLKRLYSGQTYWSKNECLECEQRLCSNIYHCHKRPSDAERTIDWYSLVQLFCELLKDDDNPLTKLSYTTQTFINDCSDDYSSLPRMKSHAIFYQFNWTDVTSRKLHVPNDFLQFVKGKLCPLSKSPRTVGRQLRRCSAVGIDDTSRFTNPRVFRVRSKTFCSSTSISVTTVEGVTRQIPLSQQVNEFDKHSDSHGSIHNTTSKHDVKSEQETNILTEPRQLTRKTSIEQYRQRLEEITKVLENNRNVIQSVNNDELKTSSNYVSSYTKLQLSPEANNANLSDDKKKLANKIYSENDSIRRILLKYGLIGENELTEASHNHIATANVATSDVENKESGATTDLICGSNNIEEQCSKTPKSQVETKVSFCEDNVNNNDRSSSDKILIDVQVDTSLEEDNEELIEKENTVPVKENSFFADDENKEVHASMECTENDPFSSNDDIDIAEKQSQVLLLSRLHDLGLNISAHRSPQIQRIQSQIKRHSSDVTPAHSPSIPRSQSNQNFEDASSVKLTRSATAPFDVLSKVKLPERKSKEEENLITRELLDNNEIHRHSNEVYRLDNETSCEDETRTNNIHLNNVRCSATCAPMEDIKIRVWKPGEPDQTFLHSESMKLKIGQTECRDCGEDRTKDQSDSSNGDSESRIEYVCRKCLKSRVERKKAIIELIETETNYGYDLRILKEEFYIPIKRNSICSQSEVTQLFSNLQELVDVNSKLCTALREGLEFCIEHDDHEYTQLAVGAVFLNCVEFFEAYEVFCAKQQESLELLEALQKKSELLRIFLDVSSKDNSKLRKMDLKSFLTMAIQRIMKYPLLLSRIYKNTPCTNTDKQLIKLASTKIEHQIETINYITRHDSSSRADLKRGSNSFSSQQNLELADLSRPNRLISTLLQWKGEETFILLQDSFEVVIDNLVDMLAWNTKKKPVNVQAFLCVHGALESFGADSVDMVNSENVRDVKEVTIVLLKKKSSDKFTLYKSPLYLNNSVVSINQHIPMKFEVLERDKQAFIFTAHKEAIFNQWMQIINSLLNLMDIKWRKRRGGMSNIMIPSLH